MLRAEKLAKKARKAKLLAAKPGAPKKAKAAVAKELFALAAYAQGRGWSAEELLRGEARRREKAWRQQETLPRPHGKL